MHVIRRVEGVGGCELSLRNSLRSAASANEFGQPTSWPRTDAPTVGEHTSQADLAQEDKGGQSQFPADTGPRDAVGPSGGNRENVPPQSYFRLYSHIGPHSTLFGGHDAGNGHIGG